MILKIERQKGPSRMVHTEMYKLPLFCNTLRALNFFCRDDKFSMTENSKSIKEHIVESFFHYISQPPTFSPCQHLLFLFLDILCKYMFSLFRQIIAQYTILHLVFLFNSISYSSFHLCKVVGFFKLLYIVFHCTFIYCLLMRH